MHPDEDHHQEDPELPQQLDRLGGPQEAEEGRTEKDASQQLSEHGRVAEPGGHPSSAEGGPEREGDDQQLSVHLAHSSVAAGPARSVSGIVVTGP